MGGKEYGWKGKREVEREEGGKKEGEKDGERDER